jgi:hypothetical protein
VYSWPQNIAVSSGRGAQLEQRLPHQLRGALDHPAAADREQGVAGEQQLVLRKEIVDLAEGVPRRLDHLRGKGADLDAVAFADLDIDGGNLGGFPARGDDAAMVALLECGDAAGVVAMMMGDENIGQRPAGGGERGLDGRRLRRIDGGGGAGRGIVHEDAVIVLEAGKQPGLRSHRPVHELIQGRVVAWPGDACSFAARVVVAASRAW